MAMPVLREKWEKSHLEFALRIESQSEAQGPGQLHPMPCEASSPSDGSSA